MHTAQVSREVVYWCLDSIYLTLSNIIFLELCTAMYRKQLPPQSSTSNQCPHLVPHTTSHHSFLMHLLLVSLVVEQLCLDLQLTRNLLVLAKLSQLLQGQKRYQTRLEKSCIIVAILALGSWKGDREIDIHHSNCQQK